MWLALDTATDRASVALGYAGSVLVSDTLAGARRHAAQLIPLVERCLAGIGASVGDLEGVVLADGPGSFTGLRVGATVAKALVGEGALPLWVTPSLLGLAAAQGDDGAMTLAVSDALRGELFAGAWTVEPGKVTVVLEPTVVRPEALAGKIGRPARIVGPAAEVLGGSPSWPDARVLLGLVGRAGGVSRVDQPAAWEPVYGRPAEAQLKWEQAHGRPLPDPARARG
jgi:tRNA threonylcarbamoyladenosine biosynthesis protein TsaB